MFRFLRVSKSYFLLKPKYDRVSKLYSNLEKTLPAAFKEIF